MRAKIKESGGTASNNRMPGGVPPQIAIATSACFSLVVIKMTKNILHLNLKKHWFALIACGFKHDEYRENKLYWNRRLLVKSDRVIIFRDFDEIWFRNGYSKDCPFMRVQHFGTELKKVVHPDSSLFDYCFVIKLGKILEIRNYKISGNGYPGDCLNSYRCGPDWWCKTSGDPCKVDKCIQCENEVNRYSVVET